MQLEWWLTAAELSQMEARVIARLDRLEQLITTTLTMGGSMAATLNDLKNAVAAERTVSQSAITLLNQLTGMIQANANDPVAIQAILDDVNAQKQALADAITANTPADTAA